MVTAVTSGGCLAVSRLCKSYGPRVVLEDASFRVERGELVAVVGHSGAGKTTLFRCIASLTPLDSGEVVLNGTSMLSLRGRSGRRSRRQIAVVFQQFNLVRRLSALDNVLAGRLGYVSPWRGWLRHFTRADVLCALECLDRVGLLEYAHQRADTMSGGQQQRVAIARALAQQPSVVLADEPVASLDPQTSAGIMELLRGIARTDGVAIVCSLHQVELARTFADRIVGLSNGRIVVDVTAASFDDTATTAAYHDMGSSSPTTGAER